MKAVRYIALLAALFLAAACRIDPPLHLRKAATTAVVMQTSVTTDLYWQVNWQAEWDFVWKTNLYGPIGYRLPTAMRMHVYTHGDTAEPIQHFSYNFEGMSGQAEIFLGVHDLLFHNIRSEYNLFRQDSELADVNAYTRIISSGLRSSIPVMTTRQKTQGTRAGDDGDGYAGDEPVAYMPDDLFSLLDKNRVITDNLDDYEYEDGRYVLKIRGDLLPASFIYLIQVKLLNNLGRVTGSSSGAALTGVASEVDLNTRETSPKTVCVPTNVMINSEADPDLLGMRFMTFGIPGCNPYDAASVAAAPAGRHFLVLNLNFATGKYKNVRIDITDLVRALPTGGVISLELDVNDFPPEDVDPPIDDDDGGFKALIGDWKKETGSATIIN